MRKSEPTHRRSEKEIFFQAIEKSTLEERAAYLDRACRDDASLRQRVENLLAKHFHHDTFMKQPAVGGSPTVVLPQPEGPGTVIARYRLLEKLGEGGFGVVYVAEQKEPVKRRVALKIIKLGMDTRQVIGRFEAERQALALMDHPNIAKVLDAGATETGRPYFVMELVRGVPITRYCDENHLPTVERLRLFITACHAIQHAHQKGIIHRDIKPSNILVTLHDGLPIPKVIDFGIAKATHGELTDKTIYTQFQQFIGTPAYISPEQAEMSGLDLDTRSDIYSLGVLLYELLTSKTPIDGEALMRAGLDELRRVIREQDAPRPSTRLSTLAVVEALSVAKHHNATPDKLAALLRGDLDWIVMKCLEKDRTRRYDTASGLAADLKRYLNNEPVVARPPSSAYRLRKFVRRHKRAVAAVSAVALALVLGLSFATVAFLREREARLNQTAAEKARQAETVRADAVGTFMEKLLGKSAPELLLQGHQRPVRDLLEAADQLASTALSNAPAAELQLRGLMSVLYLSEGPSLMDSAAAHEQMKRITELLPRVPDDKLPVTRDDYRIGAAIISLWAGHTERGLAELQALKEEFRRRTPPDNRYIAWSHAQEGIWHVWKGDAATAVEKLTEALRMAPADTPFQYTFYIRIHLALALADRGEAAEAEKVAREGLLAPAKSPSFAFDDARTSPLTPGLAPGHIWMLSMLVDTLCQQERFADAASLLREQKRERSAHSCPPRALLAIEKKLGEVLARAGNAGEALPVLMSVATNSLGTAQDCVEAAAVAIGSGDLKCYRHLCGIGLLRFPAGAEGINALSLSEMFLAAHQDELILQVVADLVQRAEHAPDFCSRESVAGARAGLLLRKGHLAEAAASLPGESEVPVPATPIAARLRKADHLGAITGFRRAIALGHLGRSDEARRFYSEGSKNLGPPPSADQPRDLGESYASWYLAEAHRREAEQVFKAKGIAIPDGEVPLK
jgi:serine/threonine protein kinase/tetratricopeptide (TPR) repeat protein